MSKTIDAQPVSTRRTFLTKAAAASAVVAAPAAAKAGVFTMATKDEVHPVNSAAVASKSANLFLIEDLDDESRSRSLTRGDLTALREVADWTKSFVTQPHRDLGRTGPVCPFTPVAIEHKALWLVPERSAGRTTREVTALVKDYQRLLLSIPPAEEEGAKNKSIVVVFTDLTAANAKDFIGAALEPISTSSYVNDGLVMGPFFEGNDGTAIYNPGFRPFTSPVPFLLIRRAVVSDWKFFLNNGAWFDLWARRYGESGTRVLAEEIRRLPWNARGG